VVLAIFFLKKKKIKKSNLYIYFFYLKLLFKLMQSQLKEEKKNIQW